MNRHRAPSKNPTNPTARIAASPESLKTGVPPMRTTIDDRQADIRVVEFRSFHASQFMQTIHLIHHSAGSSRESREPHRILRRGSRSASARRSISAPRPSPQACQIPAATPPRTTPAPTEVASCLEHCCQRSDLREAPCHDPASQPLHAWRAECAESATSPSGPRSGLQGRSGAPLGLADTQNRELISSRFVRPSGAPPRRLESLPMRVLLTNDDGITRPGPAGGRAGPCARSTGSRST